MFSCVVAFVIQPAADAVASGTLPVLATPFTADGGAVDRASLRRLVDYAVDAGADGLVYPGVASEFSLLTVEERTAALETVSATAGGRLPVIVGASADDPRAAAALAAHGRRLGATAAMVMAPPALGRDRDRLIAFFARVVAEGGLPIILQNAPPPVGAGLAVSEVAAVATAVAGIRSVKEETLPSGQRITQLLAQAPATVESVIGGAGGRYLVDELLRGAAGTMPACELTEVHAAMVAAHHRGDEPLLRALFGRVLPLLNMQAVFRMSMTKATLRRRGLIRSEFVRAPVPALDARDRSELAVMLGEVLDLLIEPLPAVVPETNV